MVCHRVAVSNQRIIIALTKPWIVGSINLSIVSVFLSLFRSYALVGEVIATLLYSSLSYLTSWYDTIKFIFHWLVLCNGVDLLLLLPTLKCYPTSLSLLFYITESKHLFFPSLVIFSFQILFILLQHHISKASNLFIFGSRCKFQLSTSNIFFLVMLIFNVLFSRMTKMKYLTIISILFITKVAESYKILVVFPFPMKSHAILGDGYVKHLLDAGHQVSTL